MSVYHHILLAVDFSSEDSQVVQKARNLASQIGARLSLIHVLDNIPILIHLTARPFPWIRKRPMMLC